MALELDMRGRPCPVPIIEAARALAGLAEGEELLLRGTDLALPEDLRAFCASAGHELLSVERSGDEIRGRLRKGAPAR